MRHKARITGAVLAATLVVGACGSSGSKALSDTDYINSLDDLCRDVTRGANRLDQDDPDFFDDALDLFNEAAKDLGELKPPKSLERDHSDVVTNLDDTIAAFEDLRDAVDDSDERGIERAQKTLTDLSADLNEIAEDIGADNCIDVGFSDDSGTTTTTTTTTTVTVPESTIPETTTTTEAPQTTTANTPLPIETVPPPPTTEPPMTAPPGSGDGLGQAAPGVWAPPAGWSWGDEDPTSWVTLYEVPEIAATLTGYWIGRIINDTTGQNAIIFISESSIEWTPQQIDAIWTAEAVASGTEITTPGGLLARINIGVGDTGQFDAAAAVVPNNSIAIFTTTGGQDLASLIDAIYDANV